MQLTEGTCRDKQCLFPQPCRNLDTDHSNYLGLLRELRSLPGIKKVFIRSGIRYDYILAGDNDHFLRELCEHHVSGQLKVAPEHCSSRVIAVMQKSGKNAFLQFKKRFEEINLQIGKKQYLVPYFMCGHPGCTIDDSIELAEFCRDIHYHPEQVQEFIPTPGSLSSAIFYTGIHPLTGKEVYVPKSQRERRLQRALLQYTRIENRHLVEDAICQAGKQRELIGFGSKCLLRPLKISPVSVRRQPAGRNKKQK